MLLHRVYLIFFLFFLAILEARQPSPCFKEQKYLVCQPLLHLYSQCSEDSSFVTQAIYGHSIVVIQKMEKGWAFVETEDGYRGYCLTKGLILDNPAWRTSKKLYRTDSIAALVYPVADTEKPAILRLPFDARIELKEELKEDPFSYFEMGSMANVADRTLKKCPRWLEVCLIDGKTGWIQRGDIRSLTPRSLDELVALSYRFLELPYIWGGTSSEGFDCSGYVQTLFKQIGVMLPRDSQPQSTCTDVLSLHEAEKPGDLLFFGKNKINHVAMYLGNGTFIHSGVNNYKHKISIDRLDDNHYRLLEIRRVKTPEYKAEISTINADIETKLKYSWRDDNPIQKEDLRYICLNHWGFDGCVHDGEIIVHKELAQEVVDIFEELFLQRYPIEKMLLIDNYQANDLLSCEDNNSSGFCSRLAVGKSQWSDHSFGSALDINPLLNPYHNGNLIIPENGKNFVDRSILSRGLIDHHDACYKAFTLRGWKWGGDWMEERGYVDYQHFYKEFPSK